MEPRAPASEQRTAPRCAAACDIDGACQRVLAQHQEAPDVIVPDLLGFVNQSLLPRLRTLIEQAQTQTPGAGKKLKSKLSKDSDPGSKAKPRKEGRRKTKGRSEAEEQDVEIEGDGDGDDDQQRSTGEGCRRALVAAADGCHAARNLPAQGQSQQWQDALLGDSGSRKETCHYGGQCVQRLVVHEPEPARTRWTVHTSFRRDAEPGAETVSCSFLSRVHARL